MDDIKLITKFGSWVRVQVAFYDFIFEQALELCPKHATEAMLQGFSDGKDPYEDAVKAIEGKFTSFNEAWAAFNKSLNSDGERTAAGDGCIC